MAKLSVLERRRLTCYAVESALRPPKTSSSKRPGLAETLLPVSQANTDEIASMEEILREMQIALGHPNKLSLRCQA